ncbi:MAG: hypothetical protein VKJ06_05370 [Vampirovibrionales bacterium]|nr:hypothetical protein [Vampirovibrionales bacterium]
MPALRHAQQVWAAHQPWLERFGVPLTISGGVNAFTGQYLAQPAYGFIAGAAAGTIARQVVWPYLALDSGGLNPVPPSQALKAAQQGVARVLSTATTAV